MSYPDLKALLLGASGMVGSALRLRAARADLPLECLSRTPPARAQHEQQHWIVGDLFRDRIDFAGDCVLSAGPLDGLVAWLQRESPSTLRRVVALSSTSVHVKQHSDDADERALSARLRDAEAMLVAWCASRDVRWTILRPTLLYDDQFAGALGRIVSVARTLGAVALPSDARGLRQPVHVDDVARAMLAAIEQPQSANHAYDLPGGETLDYRNMVARVLAIAVPHARLLSLSPRVFALAGPVARRIPALAALKPEVLARMRDDLVFDAGAAARDLGHAPRRFPAVPVEASPG